MMYCKNSDLIKMINKYKETKDPKIKNDIGKSFIQIAERFLRKPSFIDYSEDRKKEMVSDATYYMWRFFKNFDVSRGNAFAFFTTVAKHAFLQYLNERKKYNNMFTLVDYIEFFNKKDIDTYSSEE